MGQKQSTENQLVIDGYFEKLEEKQNQMNEQIVKLLTIKNAIEQSEKSIQQQNKLMQENTASFKPIGEQLKKQSQMAENQTKEYVKQLQGNQQKAFQKLQELTFEQQLYKVIKYGLQQQDDTVFYEYYLRMENSIHRIALGCIENPDINFHHQINIYCDNDCKLRRKFAYFRFSSRINLKKIDDWPLLFQQEQQVRDILKQYYIVKIGSQLCCTKCYFIQNKSD